MFHLFRLLGPCYPRHAPAHAPAPLDSGTVVTWFDRTPRDVTRRLLGGGRVPVVGDRVLLTDLQPRVGPFVGQALALELELVAKAGRALEEAPTARSRVALAEVVRIRSARAGELAALLAAAHHDPAEAIAPFEESTRALASAAEGADWYEDVLAIHVVSGLLDDFHVAAASGLPDRERERMLRALRRESAHPHLLTLIQAAVEATPRLADRLAVWGRRLVGDALLQMYLSVNGPDDAGRALPSQPRLEPAFNDIVASHTRRMDELGLTA